MRQNTTKKTKKKISAEDSVQVNGEISKDKNALEFLFEAFIKEKYGDPIPFDRSQKLILFIQFVGATAGIYAWPPAQEFAKGKPAWIGWSAIITNPLSSVLFLTKATADFLNTTLQDLYVPKSLRGVIANPTMLALVDKYLKILVGSAICAIPFGILTYFFPLPGCKNVCLALIVAHSWVSNLIMHALSWGFILTPAFWYYRLPILPAQVLFLGAKYVCQSKAQKETHQIQAGLEKIYEKYRGILGAKTKQAAEAYVDEYLKFPSNKPEVLVGIKNKNFVDFIRKAPRGVPQQGGVVRSIFKFFGAIFTMVGILGWILSPFYLAIKAFKMNAWQAVLFGILPAYTTVVLSTFFGQHIWSGIYSYFTSCDGLRHKISLEGRLFPAPFLALSLMNLYISSFSWVNGKEYIDTTNFDFDLWKKAQPIISYIAIPALVLLSFIPLQDLINSFLRGVSTYFLSKSPQRTASRLLTSSSLFADRMQQMNGKKLMDSLSNYPTEDVSILTGVDIETFNKDMEFYNNNIPEEERPLLSLQ